MGQAGAVKGDKFGTGGFELTSARLDFFEPVPVTMARKVPNGGVVGVGSLEARRRFGMRWGFALRGGLGERRRLGRVMR